MLPTLHTPKNNIATPKRPNRRLNTKIPTQTPECYTKVTVETPGPSKTTVQNEDKCDELRNLTVAVRIRPMNARELSVMGSINVVKVQVNKIAVRSNTLGSSSTKLNYVFPYDHVFWSCDDADMKYCSQQDVFSEIGQPLLENAFQGYNACLFAYGQTGSGKSYSMMGQDSQNLDYNDNAGIIPRFCKKLFEKIDNLVYPSTATVDVSYFEIYNEKIHDLLLNPTNHERVPLKVREHPAWGPYVVNLSTHTVKSYQELKSWLLLGNKNRATAATVMNEKSSRSHTIFSIELSLSDVNIEQELTRRSKVSLVDLAGSERLNGNCSNDEKQKQGIFINKSLLTLGKVICALADHKKGIHFVPYRESVLTWLLRESLGGNSFTSMLATISPAHIHVDETLATLRYACQARSIVNRAHVNEDPHDRLIRELRTEVKRLQTLRHQYETHSLSSSSLQIDNSSEYLQELEELRNKLLDKENELEEAQRNWENRYKKHELEQIEQLAEVEKKKEELESRVRVMSNLTDNVNLSPYRTNFLEEVENLLTFSLSSKQELLKNFELWLDKCGCDYEVSLSKCEGYVNIVDCQTRNKVSCAISDIDNILRRGDVEKFSHFLNSLKWEVNASPLTESDVNSTMNSIYAAAKLLQPYINNEEKVRLAFAKFIKSAQALETALCSNIAVSKSKKVVTFRL